jgi:hypothetical protein
MNYATRYVNPKTHFALEDYLKRRRSDAETKSVAAPEVSKKQPVPETANSR